jgi:hypothetical protein
MSEFRGTINVSKPGELDAEVFLLHRDGKVAAATRATSSGTYAIAPPAGYAGGWLLGKLYRPVIGARAVAVGASPIQPVDIMVAAAELQPLEGRVVMPSNGALQWLDVHLAPRSLDGFPEPAMAALLAVGTEPVRRGTYVTTRITEPSFGFAVLPGVYRLEVDRVFQDSAAVTPPVSVQLGSVEVGKGPPAETAPIGAWLTVRGPVSVTVQMAVVSPGRL